jgi:hypothetical protein
MLAVRRVRLNATVQGVTTGILGAAGVFLATNWLLLQGGDVVGPHLSLAGQFFVGYRVTFFGSLTGAAYGFGLGFCLGFVVSAIYNRLIGRRTGGSDTP